MIAKLIEKGHAYSTENGSVYFRVSSIQNYSKLTNINSEDMIDGAGGSGPNTRRGASEKEDQKDFVLWKSFVPTDGEVSWQSRFGKGRPGNLHYYHYFHLQSL
jgi:cysteinyl-tRNA synthetase